MKIKILIAVSIWLILICSFVGAGFYLSNNSSLEAIGKVMLLYIISPIVGVAGLTMIIYATILFLKD